MAKQIKTGLDFKKIGKVARQVEIESVRLTAADAKTTIEKVTDVSLKLVGSYTTNYKILDNKLNVVVRFVLEGREGEKAALNIKAGFILLYKLKKVGFENEELEQFAFANGVYNAWPYWREFVQSTMARMSLPPLTIPVFRFPKEVVITKP